MEGWGGVQFSYELFNALYGACVQASGSAITGAHFLPGRSNTVLFQSRAARHAFAMKVRAYVYMCMCPACGHLCVIRVSPVGPV